METGIFFAFLFVTAILLEFRAFRAGANSRRFTPLVCVALLGISLLLVFMAGLFVRLRLGSGGYVVFYALGACVLYTAATLFFRLRRWTNSGPRGF